VEINIFSIKAHRTDTQGVFIDDIYMFLNSDSKKH